MTTRNNPAALPWYEFPNTRHSLEAVWRETRSRLQAGGIGQLPATLTGGSRYADLFANTQLTLSQCCGLDLFHSDTANVIPFAAPIISAYDVAPGNYYSYIVSQPSPTLEHPRVVINNRLSHSGHTAIRIWLSEQGISRYTIHESGSHAQSIAALRESRADLAAIDALSWQHLDTQGLTILDTSDPAPAPPFITGRESSVPRQALSVALHKAFARYGKETGITGLVPVTRDDYASIANSAVIHGIVAAVQRPTPSSQ